MLPPLFIWPWRKPGDPTHPVLRVALGHARNWAFSFSSSSSSSSSSPVARSFPARICTHLDYTYRNCGGKFAQKLTSSIQFVAVFLWVSFAILDMWWRRRTTTTIPKQKLIAETNTYPQFPLNNVQHTQQTHSRTTTSTSSRKEEEEQQPPQ